MPLSLTVVVLVEFGDPVEEVVGVIVLLGTSTVEEEGGTIDPSVVVAF